MQQDAPRTELDADGILADPHRFAAIWANDDLLAHFGALLLKQRDAYEKLRELVFSWVRSARDVRCLLRLADEDSAIMFLDDFVLNRAASVEVVSALVASRSTYELLPSGSAWAGHAMFVRGSSMLNTDPARRYEVAELVPIGVDADRASARALLSSALEAGRLTDEAVAEVERLFPNDRSRPRRR
jgi:hypothetical protein